MNNSKIDWPKYLLLAAMAATAYMLVLKWNDFKEAHRTSVDTSTQVVSSDNSSATTPEAAAAESTLPSVDEAEAVPAAKAQPTRQLIHVLTDSLDVLIDSEGGDIVKVALPRHYAKLNTPDEPFILLNNNEQMTYKAQSGLVGLNGTDKPGQRPLFSSDKSEYRLADGEDSIDVVLTTWQGAVKIDKVFTFKRGDYLIDMQYRVRNNSDKPWKAIVYGQILRDSSEPATDVGIGMQPFLGAATTTPEDKYTKFRFSDIKEKSFKQTEVGGWVAMVQHYFITAWIPNQDTENTITLRKFKNRDLYSFGFTSSPLKVAAGEQGSLKFGYYAGPKDIYRLEEISPYLDLTVDYSWLWWIAKPIFYFLNWLHGLLGNWGISIIVLTICVKAIFFRLSAASYRSMANMRRVQPKMLRIKELYGDDRQRMSKEMMELYKKEKVNPMGGCLPMLVQMPVFLALYWVLMESVELRHAAFLWIDDLSVKDPLFVLPLLMGFTMWIQMRLNPTPPDPTQAKIMQMMPIIFTILFMWFPAGLVLYWATNNTLSIAQQYVITRSIEKGEKQREAKAS